MKFNYTLFHILAPYPTCFFMRTLVYGIILLGLGACTTKSDDKTVTVERTTFPEKAKDATIYEVNIRQHTPEGTFSAFQKHLPKLKELGVDMLWIMPIQPIGLKNRKGSLGSYYSICDYK